MIYLFEMQFKYFSKQEIQKFIEEKSLSINKRFSQNFLINSGVVDTIINKAEITKNDLVFEIGCGLGGLTHKLIAAGCRLIGFELDKAYVKHLASLFEEADNFTLIEGDFLKNVDEAYQKYVSDKFDRILFVGNLPYNITTPIIDKIFASNYDYDSLVFMVQREVAERITAKEGTKSYGSLSIFCRYYTTPQIIINISPKSFFPAPKVDSSVVLFKKNEVRPDVIDEKLFFKVVRSLFINRRKQLKNNLIMSPILQDIPREKLMEALGNSGISPSIRGEMLSIETIVKLANELSR